MPPRIGGNHQGISMQDFRIFLSVWGFQPERCRKLGGGLLGLLKKFCYNSIMQFYRKTQYTLKGKK